MTPQFLHSLSPITTYSSWADPATFEPDDEWKRQLKSRIHLDFQSRVQDATDKLFTELRNVEILESLGRLDIEYEATLAGIKQLANGQYQAELKKERNKRRQIAGESIVRGLSSHSPSPHLLVSVPPVMPNPAPHKTHGSNASKIGNILTVASTGAMASYESIKTSELNSGEDTAKFGIETQSHPRAESASQDKLTQALQNSKTSHQETQKITDKAQEEFHQLEEEVGRMERKIRERKWELHVREEELKRREAEARMEEVEAQRMEVEAQHKERTPTAERTRRKQEAVKREEAQRAEQACAEEAALEQLLEDEIRRERVAEQARRARAETEQPIFDVHSPSLTANDPSDDLFLDPKLVEEQVYIWQQVQYQQRAEAILRKHQEQRSHHANSEDDTFPSPKGHPSQPPPIPSRRKSPFPQASLFNSPSPSERSSSTTSSVRNRVGLTRSNSGTSTSSATSATSATSVPMLNDTPAPKPAMNIPLQGQPRTVSASSATHPIGTLPRYASRTEEWQRRQEEFTKAQQEKSRREQEKAKADMQTRSASKPVSCLNLQKVFEIHERLWSQLPEKSGLTWHDFPWPVVQNGKVPASPSDISYSLVAAYMHSAGWPNANKTKDRIKGNMKRWHPDQFQAKFLPRVIESEMDNVKRGAENMERYLSDLLRKENADSGDTCMLSRDDTPPKLSKPAHGLHAANSEVERTRVNTQERRTSRSGSSFGRSADEITFNAVYGKEHTFAQPTDARFGIQKNQPTRAHRVFGPTAPAVHHTEANGATSAHATPIPATSTALSMKRRVVGKAVKRKVTIEDVPDKETDHRGETLPVDSLHILEDAVPKSP